MLRVYRGRGTIFAECSECGSYGTAPHLQPSVRMSQDIEAALERHTAHMMTLKAHFQKAAHQIATEVQNGSMKRDDGARKVKELWDNHAAQVHLGEAALPSPDGQITEFVTSCPWCGAKEQVDVEVLPDGAMEPNWLLPDLLKQQQHAKKRK